MSGKTFVLLPGAWHRSGCWQRIARLLESAGHASITPDLPGCEPGAGDAATGTLEQWTASICGVLETQRGKTVLVGHSRAGIVMSQVAQRMPERIAELVYVAGFLLRDAESVLRVLREEGSSPLLRNATLSPNRRLWVLAAGSARQMFYGGCDEEDARQAVSQLGAEPAAPLMTPLRLSEDRFGSVPRTYIECLRDGAVPLSLQRLMHARLPCRRVVSLDTDHAPFLSAPDTLSAELLKAGD